MDKIRQKAQSLLEKLHDKYGVQSKHHIHLVVATMGKKEGEGTESQDHWYLVDTHGQKFKLPKTMLFLGREECDVVVSSQSVDKRHAILAFDPYLNRFKVKDLSTTNGTFVNNSRLPEQEYVIVNHMDSIRLGQDAMMYHIEQASQITNHGGHLPDPMFIPSWASRAQDSATIHVHSHPLAECQLHYIGLYGWFPTLGCIAEQNIEHSCSLKRERMLNNENIHLEDIHHSHHHHSQHVLREHLIEHQLQSSGTVPILSQDLCDCHNRTQNQQFDQIKLQRKDDVVDGNQDQSIPDEDQTIISDYSFVELSDFTAHDRDTLPIKRQSQHVAPVCSVLNTGAPESPSNTESEDHTSRNVQTMFFVPFDDSVSNTNNSSETVDQRMRSDSFKNSQPSELATKNTTKKRTPLYGQPSWWGDADGIDGGDSSSSSVSPKHDGDRESTSMSSPPSSLGLSTDDTGGSPITLWSLSKGRGFPTTSESVSKGSGSPTTSAAALKAGSPATSALESKVGGSPTTLAAAVKDGGSPIISAAVSKDSGSPTVSAKLSKGMEGERMNLHKGPTYMEIPLRDHVSPKSVTDPKSSITAAKILSSSILKENTSALPVQKESSKTAIIQSPSAEVNPAMSFTIDLDDTEHLTKKSLNISSSISQFVPSKIRKNFQDRKFVSSKSISKESAQNKNSEEHELSPVSQSSKVDEIWSIVVEGKGKSRLTNTQTVAAPSLRPPNLAEISRLSDASEERRSLDKNVDKKGAAVRKSGSCQSPQLLQSSKVVSSSSTKLGSTSQSVSVSEYPDPTSYLFDKMFEGGTTKPVWTDKVLVSEQQQGKVVTSRDKISCLSAEKIIKRPVIDSTSIHDTSTKSALTTTAAKKLVLHSNEDDIDDLRIIEDTPSNVNKVGEKDEKEDKISEAGTYTIEADVKEEQEEEEARRRIDLVFGVDVENFPSQKPVKNHQMMLTGSDGYDNVYDIGDDSENTLLDDSNISPCEDDTDYILDDFDDESSDMATTDGVQTWVSQLTSLTSQKSTELNRLAKEDGEASLSKKPPQGANRKRPGTGRRLPTIPLDKSPINNEINISLNNRNLITGEDVVRDGIRDRIVSSSRSSSGSSSKTAVISSQPRSRNIRNGYPASPSNSSCSRNSFDSELSFQGTAATTVGMPYKFSHDKKKSKDSYIDFVSTAALVNGTEDFVTPILYRNPRDALAKRQQKDLSIKHSISPTTPPASLGKNLGVKLHSQTVTNPKIVTTPRSTPSSSGTNRSSVLTSRKSSLDNGSIVSDLSSEAGDGSLPQSSKTKAAITMTRTNKTFELRRARAGSLDEPSIPRSAKPLLSVKSSSTSSSARSHSSSRNKLLMDSNRSEATSLGLQIVKKSQGNITQDTLRKTGNTVLSKIDTGRQGQSQKLQRASSLTISHPVSGGKREPTPKSLLRSTPTNRNSLTIKGISNISSKSQSQPGSRSNSPKAAEKMAWKRRKEYDARKAVADAKASKGKDLNTSGATTRPKPSTSSNIHNRMIRSASYTNTAGLSLCLHNSVSSSQNFADKIDSYNHHHEDLRRAFMPFHNSHHNDRSTHSADEDDSIASATSTQESAKNLVSMLEIPSAFTPPLLRYKPVSPADSSSPSDASLSLRMRTLNLDRESSPSVARTAPSNGVRVDMGHSLSQRSSQTSYDSLIVTSVYQLSQKLITLTDIMFNNLRDHNQITDTPSPIDDYLNDSGKSEITAWKTANQELASTLKNLRILERHMQIMNTTLFPDVDRNSDVSLDLPATRQVKQKLIEDIERKCGFQPIYQPLPHPHPDDNDVVSPEMVELSEQF